MPEINIPVNTINVYIFNKLFSFPAVLMIEQQNGKWIKCPTNVLFSGIPNLCLSFQLLYHPESSHGQRIFPTSEISLGKRLFLLFKGRWGVVDQSHCKSNFLWLLLRKHVVPYSLGIKIKFKIPHKSIKYQLDNIYLEEIKNQVNITLPKCVTRSHSQIAFLTF